MLSPDSPLRVAHSPAHRRETTSSERERGLAATAGRCVALLGVTRNTDNYGVRVLLTSAVEALSFAEPDADIVVLDYGRNAESWTEHISGGGRAVRLLNLRFSWRVYLQNNIALLIVLALLWRAMPFASTRRWLQRSNQCLDTILQMRSNYAIAGGDSFSDIYGLKRFFYVTLPQILVLLLKRPLVLLPQTYGPFKGACSRWVARWILRRASKVLSRDAAGVETVKGLIGGDQVAVSVMPDLGFCMQANDIDPEITSQLRRLRERGPLIGLNVSRLLYIGGYTGKNMFGLRESFPQLIDHLLSALTTELGAQVLLVPHVCGGPASQEDETRLCEKLRDAWRERTSGRVHCIEQRLDHQQMKTVIGHCNLFVGARMHACIGAVSQGVPTVCLAYSGKFEGVMNVLGESARVVDLRTASIDGVTTAIAAAYRDRESLRASLASSMPAIRIRARGLA